MKAILFIRCNKLLIFVIALIGFTTSCSKKLMYGTPEAKFIFKFSVKSEKDNSPIKNIHVMVGDTIFYKNKNDLYNTDSMGNYVFNIYGNPGNRKFRVYFRDIDSTQNGQFQNMDTIIEFKNPKFTGGDGSWYAGQTEMEINVKLKPKNNKK